MPRQPFLNSSVFYLGCVLLALAVLVPDIAHAQILDNIGTTYQNASRGWEAKLSEIAKSLFIKLALVEVLWAGIWWVLQRDDPNQMMVEMLKKIMSLMFFWAILLNFNTWIPAVIGGFAKAGQVASDTEALTPGLVLDKGLSIAAKVAAASEKAGLFEGGMGTTIISGLVALGILLAFTVIAGQMLVTLVESYIVVSGGVLFLGFAGSRWTTTFAEKYLSYSVSVGVKLFVTYLIIGLGDQVTDGWAAKLVGKPGLPEYLEILGGAMVYMFLGWQIPSLASSMLTGAVSMTLGSAAATVGTMVAGAAGAAGLAQAGASGVGNSVAGAMKAGNAAIDQARAGGSKGFMRTAGGAMGALGSAGMDAASDTIKGLGGGSTGGNLANRMAGKSASLAEAAAAGAPAASVPGSGPAAPAVPSNSAPSAPGSQPAAPAVASTPAPSAAGSQPAAPAIPASSGGSGSTLAPSSPAPASTSSAMAGTAASQAAPQSSVIDTSGNVSQALADRDSGAAFSPPAPVESPAATPDAAATPAAPAATPDAAATPAAPAATPGAAATPAAPAAAPGAAATPAAPAAAPGAAATPAAPAATPGAAATPAAPAATPGAAATPAAPAATPGAAATPAAPAATLGAAATPAAPAATPGAAATPVAPAAANTAIPSAAPPVQPDAREARPNALQQLSEHASALGAMPNDSAAGAGVQINLKHD